MEPMKKEKKGLIIRNKQVSNEKSSQSKTIIFGVGINNYQAHHKLYNAVKDVKDIIELLYSRYQLDDHITFFDEEATRENIIDELHYLSKYLEETDSLIIYYSGHGHLAGKDHNTRGYWVPFDAKPNALSGYIPNSTIKQLIGDLEAKHTLLISDACFSGSFLYQGQNRSNKFIIESEKEASRWAICSGRHNEEVADGPAEGNSPFAKSIIDVLGNNKIPFLSFIDFAYSVKEQTYKNYNRQMPQVGKILGTGDKGGQFYFKLKMPFYPEQPKVKPNEEKLSNTIQLNEIITSSSKTTKASYSMIKKWIALFNKRRFEILSAIPFILVILSQIPFYFPEPGKITGEIKDNDGNVYQVVKMKDNREWLGSNLSVEVDNSWCYKNEEKCNEKGRLYTLESAKEACRSLGNEWRLPTIYEWIKLGESYEKDHELINTSIFAYRTLRSIRSEFHLMLSGWKNKEGIFEEMGTQGYYWANTYTTEEKGRFIMLEAKEKRIFQFQLPSSNGLSCRCIKENSESDKKGKSNAELETLYFSSEKNLQPDTYPIAEDPDGNKYPIIEMRDGNRWTAKNMALNIPGSSFCFLEKFYGCDTYGRLYTWEAAQKACSSLGEGWHLPSEMEWMNLINHYQSEYSKEKGKSSYNTLIEGKGSTFNVKLGGIMYKNKRFSSDGILGFFWTASDLKGLKDQATFIAFNNSVQWVYSDTYAKSFARSCRCVNNILQ